MPNLKSVSFKFKALKRAFKMFYFNLKKKPEKFPKICFQKKITLQNVRGARRAKAGGNLLLYMLYKSAKLVLDG